MGHYVSQLDLMKTSILTCDRCTRPIERPETAEHLNMPPALTKVLELKTPIVDLCLACSAELATWFKDGAP